LISSARANRIKISIRRQTLEASSRSECAREGSAISQATASASSLRSRRVSCLFDLHKDTVKDIARLIGDSCTPSRVETKFLRIGIAEVAQHVAADAADGGSISIAGFGHDRPPTGFGCYPAACMR
jgi:hypothetical protein